MKKILRKTMVLTVVTAVFLTLLSPAAQAATSTSQAGIVSVSWGSLNVRSDASTGSSILTRLPKGTYVTLISKSGSFWKVEYAAGRYGYVHADYITQVSGAKAASVNITSGYLNVRSGAGTSYGAVAKLYKGNTVIVLSSANGWSRILYNGTQTGYVSATYLSSYSSAATGLKWPVPASGTIVQYFSSGTHLGIDIAPAAQSVVGDSIVAAAGGKVVYSGWLSGYGYVVYINSTYNGQYIQTRYSHLNSSPYVSAGSTAYAGQTIGAMGKSGNATGVHLHFEVRIRNSSADCISNSESTPVNPLNYVSK